MIIPWNAVQIMKAVESTGEILVSFNGNQIRNFYNLTDWLTEIMTAITVLAIIILKISTHF